MKEQQIQTKIIKYIQASGGYVVKVITASKAGVPDILCCIKGKFIGIEVKTETGRASPLQLANIELIKQAGGEAAFIRSIEDAAKYLRDIK
jgi:Holliday junction resolvase